MKLTRWIQLCITTLALAFAVLLWSAPPASAQDNPKPFVPHYYHLVFVVKELEGGKVINSRSYSTSVSSLDHFANANARSIRTGTQVPYEYEQGKITTQNVGVNIDCSTVVDFPGKVGLSISADISSVQKEPYDAAKPQTSLQGAVPLIQRNTWNSQVIVTLGKPTVVFESDEVTSKRTIELELTATEIQ